MKFEIGFFGVLTLIFIVLKLTNVIAWSWWWVLSPILIPGGIGVAALSDKVWYRILRTVSFKEDEQ